MKQKHTVGFAMGEKFAELELCVFCQRMKDVCRPGECEHYAEEYDENSCSAFIKVENVSSRLFEALEARSKS